MKCIKSMDGLGSVQRLPNKEAAKLVETGKYAYVQKVEWKRLHSPKPQEKLNVKN